MESAGRRPLASLFIKFPGASQRFPAEHLQKTIQPAVHFDPGEVVPHRRGAPVGIAGQPMMILRYGLKAVHDHSASSLACLFSTFTQSQTPISYKRTSGMVTTIWLSMSGGVMMPAMISMVRMAYFRILRR